MTKPATPESDVRTMKRAFPGINEVAKVTRHTRAVQMREYMGTPRLEMCAIYGKSDKVSKISPNVL